LLLHRDAFIILPLLLHCESFFILFFMWGYLGRNTHSV
jgi:hypothetical protein